MTTAQPLIATDLDVLEGARRRVLWLATSIIQHASAGVEIAFFNSARHVGRQHLLDPSSEDLKPLRDEGFGAHASRLVRPYGSAVARPFNPGRASRTERGIDKLRGGR